MTSLITTGAGKFASSLKMPGENSGVKGTMDKGGCYGLNKSPCCKARVAGSQPVFCSPSHEPKSASFFTQSFLCFQSHVLTGLSLPQGVLVSNLYKVTD